MTRYVALLRGINVGGHNKIPMKELVVAFGKAGCRDVETYIQSGNVAFDSAHAAGTLPAVLAKAIAKAFDLDIPVIVRSAAELAAAVRANPYLRRGDEDALHVLFMADRPAPRAVATLDPARSAPDEFAVIGREIYLYTPNGLARTKLSNVYFDKQLSTITTARNWRTVNKLLELSSA